MNEDKVKIIQVPYNELQPETLQAVIEDFITRDNTDFEEEESYLLQKVERVMCQLKTNSAVLIFDTVTETCNIVLKKDLLKHGY